MSRETKGKEEKQIKKFIEKLGNEHSDVRQEAFVALVQMGEAAVHLLRDTLKAGDKQVRL